MPPELVRDMLPPGVMQHTFDITIQAPGAASFSTPLKISFPNVFNAEPGTKLNFLSFDHTTGRLVIEGTATVSEDGKSVTTDPGTGITKPGWHGLTPPGGCGSGGPAPSQPRTPSPNDTSEELRPLVLPLLVDEGGSFNFPEMKWIAPDKLPETPPYPGSNEDCPPPAPDLPNKKQPYIRVDVGVDGPLQTFMKSSGDVPLNGASFVLKAGTNTSRKFDFAAKQFTEIKPNGIKDFETNTLYGSAITVTVETGRPDGSVHTTKQKIFVSRYIDATDANHTDAKIEFAQTLNDGLLDQYRIIPVEYQGVKPDINLTGHLHFVKTASEFWFDPLANGQQSGSIEVSFASMGGAVAGSLSLAGKGVAPETYFFDAGSWETQLLEVFNNTGNKYSFVTAAQRALIDTAAKRTALLADIRAQSQKLYDDAGLKGVQEAAAGGASINTITFTDGTAFISRDGTGAITGATLGGATSAFAEADIDFDTIIDLYTNRNNYNKYELAFRAAQAINNTRGGPIAFYIGNYFAFPGTSDNATKLKFSLGKTGAHEIGHNIGLTHTLQGSTVLIAGGGNDVMAQGIYATNSQFFNKSKAPATVALHNSWTPQIVLDALSYYNEANTNVAGYITGINDAFFLPDAVGTGGIVDVGHDWFVPVNKPALEIRRSDGSVVDDSIDFNTVLADGNGGEVSTINLTLFSYGSQPVVIDEITTVGNGFRVQAPTGRQTLAPGKKLEVSVSFDPTVAGNAVGTLNFRSNVASLSDPIDLTGFGKGQGPVLQIDFVNGNNFGGQELSSPDTLRRQVRLRNIGNQLLTVSDIQLDNPAFSLIGLPSNLASNPIKLNFDERFDFEVGFRANTTGLIRGELTVQSNDTAGAANRKALVGTGYKDGFKFDWGNDYVAVDIGGQPLRTLSN
ncbi:MAG: hypothetical protein KGQ60_08995, partial [Planctomycetes bacterium]|nr:hypothetical protein [Planctomycetota bacterium]